PQHKVIRTGSRTDVFVVGIAVHAIALVVTDQGISVSNGLTQQNSVVAGRRGAAETVLDAAVGKFVVQNEQQVLFSFPGDILGLLRREIFIDVNEAYIVLRVLERAGRSAFVFFHFSGNRVIAQILARCLRCQAGFLLVNFL